MLRSPRSNLSSTTLPSCLPLFQGNFTEAEQLYERCQTIKEKVLGPDHPSLATTLNNRAGLLSIFVPPLAITPHVLIVLVALILGKVGRGRPVVCPGHRNLGEGAGPGSPLCGRSAQQQGGVVGGAGESRQTVRGFFLRCSSVVAVAQKPGGHPDTVGTRKKVRAQSSR